MASRRSDGVLFVAFSNDHPPRHVHGFSGETEAVIDLGLAGTVALAKRDDAVRQADAKRADVKKILKVAARHFDELAALWEAARGKGIRGQE